MTTSSPPPEFMAEPAADPLAPAGSVELLWDPQRPKRRNLVVVRADEHSLHTQWARNTTQADRNWDLCVSFYGAAENLPGEDAAEYRVLQNTERKYQALYACMHRGSPLWEYDHIAFPDDDLLVSWRDWNDLFNTCREFRLELAQPALSRSGFIAHDICAQEERYRLRYTSFVEIMTPIFSRAALEICVSTFARSASGFGLDNIWPKLLGDPTDRIAIIDGTPIFHTRPQGLNYNVERALAEGNALQRAYNAPSCVIEYGAVFARPINRMAKW